MIKINWIDSMRSDCTRKFEVILSKQHTVGEFIDSVLSERKGEWGYIGIYSEKNAFFGDPCCEYSDGKLKSNPLPNEISRKKIKKVTGDGGYSRMDYIITLEEFTDD